MSWVALAAWTIACALALQLGVAGLSTLRGGPLDIVSLGAVQALVMVALTLLVLTVHERKAPLKSSLGLRPTHPGLAVCGLGLGVALKVPVESLASFIESVFPSTDAQLIARASLYRTDGLSDVLALLVVLCGTAPLCEELFFRGALYGRVSRGRSASWAGVGTGLSFVLVHPDLRHWLPLLLVAMASSYLRVIGGSLLPCLSLHVAFNAAGVLGLVLGAVSPTRALEVPAAVMVTSWLAATLLVLYLVKLADNPEVIRARSEDQA